MTNTVRSLEVASLGPLVPDAGATWRGTVRAVSTSSCEIAGPGALLVVVHARAHGHTATSVLVDDACPQEWGVRRGDRATWRLGRLHIGTTVVLDARGAPRWTPPAPPIDLAPVPVAHVGPLDDEASARLAAPCDAVVRALAEGDRDALVPAVRALVGAGPGSTPSGDDALVGVLTVLDRAGMRDSHAMLATAVLPMLDRTTPLGAHHLGLACRGQAGERLLALVDAALGGDLRPDDERLDAVRRSGANSGNDALVGVAAALAFVHDHAAVRHAA